MGVRIRLERCGCRNRPFYRIIAADSKSPRDGKSLQLLGFYNPIAAKDDDKRVSLRLERIKYWLSVGAQPSDPVRHILFNAGLLEPPPMVVMGSKPGPVSSKSMPGDDLNTA